MLTNPQKHTYNKTILIIEDEEAMLQALYDKFTFEGFYAEKAKNGREGLELIHKDTPDVIILDIIMPTMDGISFLKEIRTIPEYCTIPVIILSNLNPNDEVRYLVAKSQPAFYLIKSETKLEALLTKVKEVLHVS